MRRKAWLLVAFFLILASLALADTLTLRSGETVEGTIVEKTADSVKIDVYGAEVTYFMDEVAQINGEPVAPAPMPEEVIEEDIIIEEDFVPEEAQVSPGKEEPQVFEEIEIEEEGVRTPLVGPETGAKRTPLGRIPGQEEGRPFPMPPEVFMKIMAFVFIAMVLIYLYSSLCLHLIAVKTNTGPAWMAWIPIANIFLMCKIAQANYLYAAGFVAAVLLSFIPLVGVIFNFAILGLSIYLWYRISLRRNKPAWVGVLIGIPFVGLVFMGYLAFSE
ncbi:MAG: hypothetical protein FJZ09_01025 [Candidatus Omnitrophica bacterium]|nr:hypothetical protein [Candidatus Omnitrophota bacterium]